MGLLNAVVDLSHHNTVTDFSEAANAGVVGVIHKATQGTDFVDATYDAHRARAKDAGLLWGAYHFARTDDVDRQVDHFLSVANCGPGELLVLDFEPNATEGSMTLSEAERFVTMVRDRTGRFPGLYSGQSYLREIVGGNVTTALSKCWLWIARYGPALPLVPAAWQGFTLWQYTDGNAGMQPHQVPGIGRCDRDKFNGDVRSLRRLWGHGSLHPHARRAAPVGVAPPVGVRPPKRSRRAK
jgi:lysozyme